MLKRLIIFLSVLSCMFYLSLLSAQEAEMKDNDIEIKVDIGVNGVSVDEDKSKVKIGEYDTLDDNAHPYANFIVKGKDIYGLYFTGKGTYYENDDQNYGLELDIARYITQEVSLSRFKHWLDHDPLTNLYASTTNNGTNVIPPFVTYTDNEPGREYGIRRTELESKTTVKIPELPFDLKAFFNFREERRKGHRQALTMSKCSSCHVVGHTDRVDEYTRDYNPGLEAEYSDEDIQMSVLYKYLRREFGDESDSLKNDYDHALHPGSGLEMFDDRVQYQDEELEYNKSPESIKDSHVGNLNLYLTNLRTGIFVSGNYSTVESEKDMDEYPNLTRDEKLKFKQKGIYSRIFTSIMPSLGLNLHFRWLDIENKNIFVDVNEPTSTAVSNIDYPWHNHDPALTYNAFNPDFLRKSAMNRELFESGIDAKYFINQWLSLRGNYIRKNTKRKNYYRAGSDEELLYYLIPEETKEDIAKAEATTRFRLPNKKTLRTKLTYKYRYVQTPFSNIKAAYVNEQSITGGNPWASTQYWELQDKRNVLLTNQPKRTNEGKIDIKIPVLDELAVSGLYRYVIKENKHSNDWENITHSSSVNVCFLPYEKLTINASYNYSYDETSALMVLPLYDG